MPSQPASVQARTVYGQGTDSNRVVRHLMNTGTDESTPVAKVDISAFGGDYSTVDLIEYSVWGFDHVRLYWAHTPTDGIAYLQGQGVIDWAAYGGLVDPTGTSTDGTGDIMLATATGGAQALQVSGYDITIHCRMKKS